MTPAIPTSPRARLLDALAKEARDDNTSQNWRNGVEFARHFVRHRLSAIEAAAVAEERARLRAAVEGLTQHAPCVSMDSGPTLDCAAVLALIDEQQ